MCRPRFAQGHADLSRPEVDDGQVARAAHFVLPDVEVTTAEAREGRVERHREAVSVDEVFVYGKGTPALVVRDFQEGKPVWDLVLLDGDEVRRYRVPLVSPTASAYVKADVNENGEIVVLVGDRGFRMQETLEDEQVVVLALPNAPDPAPKPRSRR